MTPSELRELADALAKGTHFVDSPELHAAMQSAADYLRACADAEPVAWRYLGFSPFTQMPERDYTFIRFPKGIDAYSSENGATVEPLYAHPAPAAPQADIGRLRECAQRLVDGARWGLAGALSPSSKAREIPSSAWSNVKSRHLASLRDALAAPQAEPKREPLSDEQIELPDYLRLQIASTAAAHDVLVERRRQIEVEGWTPEHDDEHVLGEMAALAAFYAVPDGVHEWDFSSTGYGNTLAEVLLPSGWAAKAGEDRRRDLVKAGALILAEIERLDRMGGSDAE